MRGHLAAAGYNFRRLLAWLAILLRAWLTAVIATASGPSIRALSRNRRSSTDDYQVQEAAQYARLTPQTIRHWQAGDDLVKRALNPRDPRAALSYMELIEVAVVAAFRKAGVSLKTVRAAREYIRTQLKKEYPFAQYDFMIHGRDILIKYGQIERKGGKGKLLDPARQGQHCLGVLIVQGRLKEFEYDKSVALRWHVAGVEQPIVIDPRVSFGAPSVNGVPTWVLKGRWEAARPLMKSAKISG